MILRGDKSIVAFLNSQDPLAPASKWNASATEQVPKGCIDDAVSAFFGLGAAATSKGNFGQYIKSLGST